MIRKKLFKHLLILSRRINQKRELQRLSQSKNETLGKILTSFHLVKWCLHKDEDQVAFLSCERYRKQLLKDDTEISYEVFSSDKTVLVNELCKKAASSKKWCEFLYYIAKSIEKPKVLEIGTNLGISGSYILEAIKKKEGQFITMEGVPKLCELSSRQFSSIASPSGFNIMQGLYAHTFPQLLKENVKFNLLFIDGNHKRESTLEYFESLKSKISSPAIFVFDDIYWSREMKEVWEIVRKDAKVNYSIDLYEQGVIIIDEEEVEKNLHFNLHLAY